MKKKTKTFSVPRAKKTLDKLFSYYIRNRDKKCCRCGKDSVQLQCSHIIPRQYTGLRWSVENAETLCSYDHRLGKNSWHQNPLYAAKEFYKIYGVEKADSLISQSVSTFTFTQDFYLRTKEALELSGSLPR